MAKANQVSQGVSSYYVPEGADLSDVPEGVRLVGPGAPDPEGEEKKDKDDTVKDAAVVEETKKEQPARKSSK